MKRSLVFEPFNQPLRSSAVVLVNDQDCDLGSCVAPTTEDHREDREESDRKNEAQRQCATVAPQRSQGGFDDCSDHSRNSLPVSCRNTDSRFGRWSDTSSTS